MAPGRGESVVSDLKDPRTGIKDGGFPGHVKAEYGSADDEAELATLVMLRRLLLVAWIGSHHTFATEAAELGAGFTAGTCTLAEAYLSTH